MNVIIISGLSGSGKTVALKQLEDLGYFCVDNMPLALIGPLSRRTLRVIETAYSRLAISIDARESSEQIEQFPRFLQRLRDKGLSVHVLYLTADDDTIIRRYSETRRPHPLTDARATLPDAIARERDLLAPIANASDETIDTTHLNIHELRQDVARRLPDSAAGRLALNVMSFGYKNGIPDIADFMFDVRCLPNPHWEGELRKFTGMDEKVVDFLQSHAPVRQMEQDIRNFLDRWIPAFEEQDRAYLTVAVGCTGGRHRSVYIVERLGEAFRDRFDSVVVKHRDIV